MQTADVALLMGVSRAAVRSWRLKGLLPSTRPGPHSWLFSRADVDALLLLRAGQPRLPYGSSRTSGDATLGRQLRMPVPRNLTRAGRPRGG